jgi:hypothetical protein
MNIKLNSPLFDRYLRVAFNLLWFYSASLIISLLFAFSLRRLDLDWGVIFTYTFLMSLAIIPITGKKLNAPHWEGCAISVAVLILIYGNLIYPSAFAFYSNENIPDLFDRANAFIKDDLFHLAITESISNFGIPSTSIHGAPLTPYHFGAHYLMAVVGCITKKPLLNIYPYHMLVLGPAVMGYFFIHRSLERNSGLMGGLAIALFFAINHYERFFGVFDFTTAVAMLLGYVAITAIEQERPAWVVIPLICMAVISKVSFGLFIYVIYMVYAIFSIFSGKRREILEAVLCSFAVLMIVIFLSFSGQKIVFDYNNFYNQILTQEKRNVILTAFFILPILTAFIFFINRDWRNFITILVVIFISFFAMHVSFINRNHMHFILAGNLISAFYLAGANVKFSKSIARLLAIITLLTALGYVLLNGQLSKRYTFIDQINWSGVGVNSEIHKFNNVLLGLREVEGHFLVRIPEGEVGFWHHLSLVSGFRPEDSRYFMALRVPVLSGKVGYRGYNHQLMNNQPVGWYPPGAYGFNSYYDDRDPCIEFSKVLTLTSGVNGLIEQWSDCRDIKAVTEPTNSN